MSHDLNIIRDAARAVGEHRRYELARDSSRVVSYSGVTTTEWDIEEVSYVLSRGAVLRESRAYTESLTVVLGRAQPEHCYRHRDDVREIDDRDASMFPAIAESLSRLFNDA